MQVVFIPSLITFARDPPLFPLTAAGLDVGWSTLDVATTDGVIVASACSE